jgi:tetratricopeptide (TPR) repeat protein
LDVAGAAHRAQVLQRNAIAAEGLLAECIYVLDRTPSALSSMPMLLSELGCTAMQQYAETLLSNGKYKYAIHVFDACLSALQLRRRRDAQYFALLRRVASLAQSNNDFKHAVKFYDQVLARYTEERKTSEIVLVSEILYKLFMDNGEFSVAEDYLLDALAVLPAPSETERMDARVFQLQIKLASLYAAGYLQERGIEVLEKLARSEAQLPAGKISLVLTALAQARRHRRRLAPVRRHRELMVATYSAVRRRTCRRVGSRMRSRRSSDSKPSK